MNEIKNELIKKKALLEEYKRRRKEKELSKLLQTNQDTKNEFDNLNPDEILSKCGLTSSTSLITPSSSSLSLISFSSSSHSISNLKKIKSSPQIDQESFKKLEKLNLEFDDKNKIDIYPIEKIKYTKETQTNEQEDLSSKSNLTDNEDELAENISKPNLKKNSKKKSKSNKQQPLAFYDDIFVYDTFQWEDEFSPLHTDNHKHHKESNQDSDAFDDDDPSDDLDHKLNSELLKLNEDSKSSNEIDYDDFLRFMVHKRPIIERALKQNEKSIYFDYTQSQNEQDKTNNQLDMFTIQLKKSFKYEKILNSVVTCLDWSLQYPELLLCSYDNMSFNYDEADTEAFIALWNVKSDQKIPQQTFSTTSLTTSCIFSSHNPNLIISGTYSGQIVMYDIRTNKRTPVQRSSLSIHSHVNPVYCIKVLDQQSLISISNDGKLCTWSLENLNLPIDSHDLILKHATNRQVYATCLDFQTVYQQSQEKEDKQESTNTNTSNNTRQAIIGAEDGLTHSLNIYNKFNLNQTFEGHFGPVTSVNCFSQYTTEFNTQSQSINNSLSQLFLTSSFDSSIKLWNMNNNTSPIYTFESHGDYVYDVGWSPIHPALFASVDGSGRIDFWNLNKDTEQSIASIDVDNRTKALNKLKWSRNGTEIAVGDDHGELRIYEISENFARPEPDEYEKLISNLDSLKKLNQEMNSFNLNQTLSSSDTNYINYLIESFR